MDVGFISSATLTAFGNTPEFDLDTGRLSISVLLLVPVGKPVEGVVAMVAVGWSD